MLDDVIIKHLDTIDILDAEVDADIEQIIQNINIDTVIDDPYEALDEIVEMIEEMMLDEYMPRAVNAGIEFANKAKEIEVEDTDNPKANEALDDKS